MKYIISIFLSILFSSCSPELKEIKQTQAWLNKGEIREQLMNSQSLNFSYKMRFSDGGSMEFRFINNHNEEIIIYFPYPDWDNVILQRQDIFIVPLGAPDFISASYLLVPQTEEERHLIKLIGQLSATDEWSPETFIHVIKERQYGWFPTPKLKKPPLHVDKSSILHDLAITTELTNISNQRVESIVTTPVDEVEAQSTQAHP